MSLYKYNSTFQLLAGKSGIRRLQFQQFFCGAICEYVTIYT